MKFSLALAVALLSAVLVNAAPGSSTVTSGSTSRTSSMSSAAPSPTAPPSNSTHINVDVASGGQLMYSPASITAKNGTIVTFTFPNSTIPHSVTQGYFAKPCAYLAAANGNPAGFDSGLQSGKQFSLNITNDKSPIYFFCKSMLHCGLGMVGAINAPDTGNTYAAYLAAAKALGSSEPVISNTGAVTVSDGVGATPVSNPPVSSSASSSTTSSKPSSSSASTGRPTGSSIAPKSNGPMY